MSFNADTFLNQTVESAFDTSLTPIPEGEYEAVIEDVKVRQFESTKVPGQMFTSLDVIYKILDENVAKEIGRDNATVRGSVFLDLTPEGNLDYSKGRNIGLGQLREAVRQNDPNRPWMPGMLKGAGPLLIYVTQRPDANREGVIFNDVRKFTGL